MPRYIQEPRNGKKRKFGQHLEQAQSPFDRHDSSQQEIDTSKPTATFAPSTPRLHTLSVALPGSIIANAQSHDLKTNLAGTIARALSVFCVDEVIIFDDAPLSAYRGLPSDTEGYSGYSNPSLFLTRLLSYLECPPYLRKHLFPIHPDLRTAGTLPSLDLPHHLRAHEWCKYREGVVLPLSSSLNTNGSSDKHSKKPAKKKKSLDNDHVATEVITQIDVGLPQPISVPISIPPSARVTLQFASTDPPPGFPHSTRSKDAWPRADPVPPSAPREKDGHYWGFTVRSAASLSAVLTEVEFEGGYDVVLGTSERGTPLSDVLRNEGPGKGDKLHALRSYRHLLVLFGGLAGLEQAVKNDTEFDKMGVRGAEDVCDLWVNLVPGQGSRTVRTEESVWVGLAGLWDVVRRRNEKDEGED